MLNPHLVTRTRRAVAAFTKPVRTPSYEIVTVIVDSASPELQGFVDNLKELTN